MPLPAEGTAIEQAALRAWPPLETAWAGGWELRFARGFTKRANSVQAVGGPLGPLREAVQGCERWYAERRQPCIFRLTPLAVPDLDPYLADAGYTLVDRTAVLSLPIGVQEDTAAPTRFRPVELDEWLGTYARLSARGSPPSALRDILMRIVPPKVFATVIPDHGAGPVACGMAVLDGILIGIFDLVTSPRRRRQGYGTALLRGLLAWGAGRGAEHAYLQVVRTNLPAWTLYTGLGFRPVYDYWYRVAGRGSVG